MKTDFAAVEMAECAELPDTSGKIGGGGERCKCTASAFSFYLCLKPRVRFRGESKLGKFTPFPGPFTGGCHGEPFFIM